MFADESVRDALEKLKSGTFEQRRLFGSVEEALGTLERDPLAGEKVPSRLWPRVYFQKYGINNLHKLNLPDGWRLAYTIRGNEIEIVAIILEWMSHKQYEKRFGYKIG